MTWNHRVVRHKTKSGEPYIAIHEVFYDSKNKAYTLTKDPVDVGGETIDDLRKQLEQMTKALDTPILDYDKVPEPGADPDGA